jgi:hypothetical protein
MQRRSRATGPAACVACTYCAIGGLLTGCDGDGTGGGEVAATATQHGWGVAQPINSETYDVFNPPSAPHIRFTADGGALAIWIAAEQHGLTNQRAPAFIGQVHSSRFSPGVGWEAEQSIDIKAGYSSWPQLEVDAEGNTLAIWSEHLAGLGQDSLEGNRYTKAAGWSGVGALASDGSIAEPQAAFVPAGNALILWTASEYQPTPTMAAHPRQTYARYLTRTGSLGPIDNIDNCGQAAFAATYGICNTNDGNVAAYAPKLKSDSTGNVIAAWVEMNLFARSQQVYVNRFAAASGTWGAPQSLGSDFVVGSVQLAVDNAGDAWAIWPSIDGLTRVARYSAETGWSAGQAIGTGNGETPQVAADNNGNALAVWVNRSTDPQSLDTWTLYASRYSPMNGWSNPVRIDCVSSSSPCPGAGGIQNPQIAFDSVGNAFAVWSYAEIPQAYHNEAYRQGQIYTNRYAVSLGWDAPQSIDVKAGEALQPQLAVDQDGHALAIWSENGQIYVNRFN